MIDLPYQIDESYEVLDTYRMSTWKGQLLHFVNGRRFIFEHSEWEKGSYRYAMVIPEFRNHPLKPILQVTLWANYYAHTIDELLNYKVNQQKEQLRGQIEW